MEIAQPSIQKINLKGVILLFFFCFTAATAILYEHIITHLLHLRRQTRKVMSGNTLTKIKKLT